MASARFNAVHTQILRYCILVTSFIAIVCLILRHYYKNIWLKKYFRIDAKSEENIYFYYHQQILAGTNLDSKAIITKKQKSFFNILFFVELLILLVFPYPFFETFSQSEFHQEGAEDKKSVIVINYFLGDYLLAFMFVRLFFLLRSIFNYS